MLTSVFLDCSSKEDWYFKDSFDLLRGNLKKKNSIFVDIAHVGGGEVNPKSKNWNEMIFDKS